MEEIIFSNNIFTCSFYDAEKWLPHVFCLEGSLSFLIDGKPFIARARDCIIASAYSPMSQLMPSEDFRCRIMMTTRNFAENNKPVMAYNVVGHLGMMQNPVLPLLPSEMEQSLRNVEAIQMRHGQSWHSFYHDALRLAFQTFVLDMYDIHSRQGDLRPENVPQTEILMRRFIALLQEGECCRERTPGHYAELLAISPVYLTEISKRVTGHTPTYWIDYFSAREIRTRLEDKHRPLSDIAEEMNFSSLSYFSRYCRKVLGTVPSKIR